MSHGMACCSSHGGSSAPCPNFLGCRQLVVQIFTTTGGCVRPAAMAWRCNLMQQVPPAAYKPFPSTLLKVAPCVSLKRKRSAQGSPKVGAGIFNHKTKNHSISIYILAQETCQVCPKLAQEWFLDGRPAV